MSATPPRSLALLALLLSTACGSGGAPDPTRPNLLLVTFDTTRRDHLGCYGYGKPTSPVLDALAEDGLRYTEAFAVSSWTLPTHASLFTGRFPTSHGARYDPEGAHNLVEEGGIKGNPAWNQYRANTIAEGQVTLAQLLTERGYATQGIIGGPWMRKVFGLDRGFEGYDDSNFEMHQGSELNGRSAEDITDAAIRFVDDHRKEPFFLFLNYYDPHGPYAVHAEYIGEFWSGPQPTRDSPEWTLARYDSEIRYTDTQFGRLLERLRELGLYEDTWIVVTSDHGELMGDGGMWGHGDSLSQPEIHLPLLVKEGGTGRRRGVDDTPVQQVDVFGTLLEAAGLERPAGAQGGTLADPHRPILAEVYPLPFMNKNKPWRQTGDWRVMIDGKWKVVWGSNQRHLLFDLEADPGELRNLVESEPDVAEGMLQRLGDLFDELPRADAVQVAIDEEMEAQMKALGYLGGEGEEPEGDPADGHD